MYNVEIIVQKIGYCKITERISCYASTLLIFSDDSIIKNPPPHYQKRLQLNNDHVFNIPVYV